MGSRNGASPGGSVASARGIPWSRLRNGPYGIRCRYDGDERHRYYKISKGGNFHTLDSTGTLVHAAADVMGSTALSTVSGLISLDQSLPSSVAHKNSDVALAGRVCPFSYNTISIMIAEFEWSLKF